MNKSILLCLIGITLSGSIINTSFAANTCSANENIIKNKKIINYDINNFGYMNVKLSGESDWRSINASPVERIQDYAKVAYLTGASLDYCLADGRIVRMVRTNDVN